MRDVVVYGQCKCNLDQTRVVLHMGLRDRIIDPMPTEVCGLSASDVHNLRVTTNAFLGHQKGKKVLVRAVYNGSGNSPE